MWKITEYDGILTASFMIHTRLAKIGPLGPESCKEVIEELTGKWNKNLLHLLVILFLSLRLSGNRPVFNCPAEPGKPSARMTRRFPSVPKLSC